MQSNWELNSGADTVTVTTERGTNESDESYLARHTAAVDDALDEVVTDEEDRDLLLDEMETELGDDLVSLGSDAVGFEITIPE